MAIAGLIISILALAFSFFTYWKHDSKIKKQSTLINEYQIKKIQEEKEIARKACIEGDILKEDRGKRILRVYNKGKTVAKKVRVLFPETKGLILTSDYQPIKLGPQQSIDINFLLSVTAPDYITIEFQWSDEYDDNNILDQTFQL